LRGGFKWIWQCSSYKIIILIIIVSGNVGLTI
jgi:hypothetical protein